MLSLADALQCDLQQPCSQCTRSSRDCKYAVKNVHIFVHHEGKHKTVYRKSDRQRKDEVSSKPVVTLPSNAHRTPEPGVVLPAQDAVAIPRPFGTLTALNQQLLASACGTDLLQTVGHGAPRPWTYTLSSFRRLCSRSQLSAAVLLYGLERPSEPGSISRRGEPLLVHSRAQRSPGSCQ